MWYKCGIIEVNKKQRKYMGTETIITFNVGILPLLIAIVTFFVALLGIVWKGKTEISDTVKKEIEPLRKTITSVVNAVNELHSVLRVKIKGLEFKATLLEKPGSPLSPTNYGASLIKESGLETVLDDNKELFKRKLKELLPEGYTEYDVQERARDVLAKFADDVIMRPVKNWVYNNPMDIDAILRVGGLWLTALLCSCAPFLSGRFFYNSIPASRSKRCHLPL